MSRATSDERLAFIVRFANLDLTALRPGDWMNLQDDLRAFYSRDVPLATGRGMRVTLAETQDTAPTQDAMRSLQSDVQQLLTGTLGSTGPLGANLSLATAQWGFKAPPAAPLAIQPPTLTIEGSLRDSFLAALMMLMVSEPPGRILRCPECGNLFLRVRKQKYCSRACVNRVNQRAFRSTPAGKASSARVSRAAYEKKVKATTGMKHPKIGTYRKRNAQQGKEK